MAHHARACDDCNHVVRGQTLDQFCDAFVEHNRQSHPDLAYPEIVLRNFAAATQRITDPGPRRHLTSIDIRPAMPDHLDDWLDFFDHTAYAGNPLDAACYCTGAHVLRPGEPGGMRPWQQNRQTMIDLLRAGRAYGYLAFAGSRVAGWINASFRSACIQHPKVKDSPPPSKTISLSCITIAPEFRGNGLARTLINAAVDDADGRGADWIEAYPSTKQHTEDRLNFRGHQKTYAELGFAVVADGTDSRVMRRPAR